MTEELVTDMGPDESPKPGGECPGCGMWVYPNDDQPTFKEIWETLSAIDVKDHTAERGNFTYLSWSWAWGVLMEQYSQAEFTFPTPTFYEDGSIEVHCRVVIGTNVREMWLPVMGNKNEAIKAPDARKINDSKMRCLVKCIAMFGLGHYIYAGEDVPTNTLTKAKARKLYEDLMDGLTKQDSFDAVKAYGDDHTDDVGNLPVDWQDMFRKDFKESLQFWRDKERQSFDGSSDQ